MLADQPLVESRIVSVDVATGARVEHAGGPGLKLSPQFLGPGRDGVIRSNKLKRDWSAHRTNDRSRNDTRR